MTDVVEAFNSEPGGVATFEDHNGLVSHEVVAEHLSAKVNNVSNKIAGIDCGGIDLDDSKILSEVVLTNAENERGRKDYMADNTFLCIRKTCFSF